MQHYCTEIYNGDHMSDMHLESQCLGCVEPQVLMWTAQSPAENVHVIHKLSHNVDPKTFV